MGETQKNAGLSSFDPAKRRGSAPEIMALCALAGAMFLWAGTFIAMKVSLTAFHPLLMTFVRLLVSSMLLLPFLRGWLRRSPYARGDWRVIAALVICEPCLYFLFEGYALKYTTASQAGLVTALLPVLVGISAFFILGERLSGRAWLGCVLAVAGVALLSLGGSESEGAPNAPLGNSLEFMAMLMATVYTLCVRKLKAYPPFFLTAMQAIGGALFFGLLVLGAGIAPPEALPSSSVLFSLAFLSFSTIVAYGLYNLGIARLSAARAAVWINLIPVITLFMGIFMLGESLDFVQSLAVPLILGGLLLSQMKK